MRYNFPHLPPDGRQRGRGRAGWEEGGRGGRTRRDASSFHVASRTRRPHDAIPCTRAAGFRSLGPKNKGTGSRRISAQLGEDSSENLGKRGGEGKLLRGGHGRRSPRCVPRRMKLIEIEISAKVGAKLIFTFPVRESLTLNFAQKSASSANLSKIQNVKFRDR